MTVPEHRPVCHRLRAAEALEGYRLEEPTVIGDGYEIVRESSSFTATIAVVAIRSLGAGEGLAALQVKASSEVGPSRIRHVFLARPPVAAGADRDE